MRIPIRSKMIFFIGLPAVLIFVGVSWWVIHYAAKQNRILHEQLMADSAQTAAARFDEYISKAARVADTTARFVSRVPRISETQIYGILSDNVRLNARIYGAAMAFEPGTYKDDDSLFSPYAYEDRTVKTGKKILRMNINEDVYDWYHDEQWEWWHKPKRENKGVWTKPYFDEGAGNILMITYSAPFYSTRQFGETSETDFRGVTTVDIDLETLQAEIGGNLAAGHDFYIIASDGQFIYSPQPGDIMNRTIFDLHEKRGRSDLDGAAREMLGGEAGEVTVADFLGMDEAMVAYAPIPSTGWVFVTTMSMDLATAAFRERMIYVLGAFTLALFLIVGAVLFVSEKLTRPIEKLREGVLAIAEGSSDVPVDEIRTGDEIEELAGAFGTMQEKVADRESKLENAREKTLSELLESAPDAMIVADAEGKICRFNGQVMELFGYDRDELEGMTVEALMPERFRAGHGKHLAAYFKAPKKRQMGAGLELLGVRKDETEFPIEIGLSPFHEPGGVMAVAAIRDITERKKAEAELRKLNQAVEQGSAMVFITDADGDMEYVNPRFTEVTGYSAEEALGQNPRMLKSGLLDPAVYEDVWETLTDGREWRGEFCNRRKDGELFWASAALAPIRDPDGKTTHYVAIEDDITAEKEIAEEIKRKEERFRTLVANLPETIYRCLHDDAWTMKFISEDVEELTGYPASDFIDNKERTFDSVIHAEDSAMVAEKVEAAVKAKEPWAIEYRIVRVDGSVRWVGERGRAIFSENGEVDYLDGVIADITQRKEMEEELQKTEFLSDIALELAHCGYWHVDYSDPDYYYQSERAARMLGEPLKPDGRYHLQDEWFARLVEANPEAAERTAERYQGAIDGRYEHYESTYAYKRPIDGAIIWLHALGKVVRDENDRIQYMYGVYQDVTQRLANEKALQEAMREAEAATRAKSEFLSHMSHELRTPLNGVLGYAQILQRDPSATDNQKQNLDAIVNCGDHLLSLINDVLDLSKIEAGRIDVDLAPADLHKLIKGVGDIVQQRASGKGISFEVEVSPEVPQGIVTDAAKLRQILVNLLGNAVKFTDKGGVTFHVAESPKGRLRFDIVDTGVGMNEEEMQHIFDPFKQVEAGKAAGGTGLGLAITRRLAERLGGEVTVKSEKGSGSTFTIDLPLEEAPTEDLGSLEAEGALNYGDAVLAPGEKMTLLVADDRETNRDILEKMLEAAGIDSLIADDGDTALEVLRAHPETDLVLMDVRMPRLNGIDAVKQIREDEDLKHHKVIAVTASVFPEFREKAIEAGFDDFLGKPFRTEELIQKLQKHLGAEFVSPDAPAGAEGEAPAEGGGEGFGEVPAEMVEKLKGALKIKNLTAINGVAKELKEAPETAAFGDEVAKRARGFDFAGLEALVEEVEK